MGEDTGRLVGGRYRLGGVLGRGGMGTVWRGEDETLGRSVAVKELRFPSSVEEDEKQRLITRTLREAKAIARIRSGSAVTVFDVVDEDDRPWIVMELIEGSSLADRIREDGPLTPQRAAEVGLAVLDVLRAAHREGVLHRDVKPSNVLLEDVTDRVVLTDFGIAKVEGDPSVTSTGMLVGAPSYISPERARGKPPGPPADLWSLGALLYASVEGHPPYDKGSAISTLTAVMTEPVPPPKQAGELSEVIFGLLTKDPEKRLDVDGARALLQPVASGAGVSATASASDGASAPGDSSTAVLPPKPDGDGQEKAVPAPDSGAADGSGSRGAKARSEASSASPAATDGRSRRGKKQAAKSPPVAAPSKPSAVAAGGVLAAAGGKTRGESSEREPAAAATADSGDGTSAVASGRGGGGGASTTFSVLVGRFSRRSLAIGAAAVVAVLALLVVVLVNAGDGKGGGNNGKKDTATSGADGGARKKQKDAPGDAKKEDKGGQNKDKPGPSKDGDGSGKKDEKPEDGPSLPDGYAQVKDDSFHFTMGMPEGFKRTGTAGQNSGVKYSGGGLPKLQVDYSGSPLADAAGGWRNLEPVVRKNSSGYHLIGIKKVSWRGYPTVADWEFERRENGKKVRVLNRGFKVDGSHGYAIMITCASGAWDDKECRTLRDTAFKTFKPLG